MTGAIFVHVIDLLISHVSNVYAVFNRVTVLHFRELLLADVLTVCSLSVLDYCYKREITYSILET